MPRHHRRGVARVHDAVAVGVLRIHARRAAGAAFRVRFSDENRTAFQLGERSDDLESFGQAPQLVLNPHHHRVGDEFWAAFGVKDNMVERRPCLPGSVVPAVQRMLQKAAQKRRRSRVRRARGVRPADVSRRKRALHGIGGEVVQLLIFLRRPLPVAAVRFVPHLPQPGLHLGLSVLLYAVLRPLVNQLRPFCVIFGRMRPPGEDVAVGVARLPVVPVGLRLR